MPNRSRFPFAGKAKWLVLPVLVIGFVLAWSQTTSVEEPKYTVSLREGAIEIRDYPATVAAEVTVTGDQRTAASKGFRLLAGYIFGGNTRHQSIAMTAPVAQQRAGETIAMTAPVLQTPRDGGWVVRFTMPARYSIETLPKPDDPAVMLRQIAPARYAVIRFSGLVSQANVAGKAAALLAFVSAHHLHTIGAVSLAQYDPPWTLWFLRRNEVLIQLV